MLTPKIVRNIKRVINQYKLRALHGLDIHGYPAISYPFNISKSDSSRVMIERCRIDHNVSMTLESDGEICIHKGCRIRPYVSLECWNGGKITIGHGTWINCFTRITSRNSIKIGARCFIGESVSIHDFSHIHTSSSKPIAEQGFEDLEVTIGDDCLIGAKATILPGVTVGTGAVIGSNAVVTADVPEYAVVVGVPGRVIKYRE